MKLRFLLLCWISILTACNSGKSKPLVNNTTGELRNISPEHVKMYNEREKSSLDSIARYGLYDIYDSCLKYLYYMYGEEIVDPNSKNNKLTVGECNIRLLGFIYESDRIRTLSFVIFINDSLPGPIPVKTSMGHMIDGFDVDINSKKLTLARRGDLGRFEMEDIQRSSDTAARSALFESYIRRKKQTLHPKFLKYLNI